MAGLTLTGLVIPSLQEIRDDLDAQCRLLFGASLDLSDATPMGQYNGILAERYAQLWEQLQAVYSSQDVDAAVGAALDALAALTGTTRNAAFPSTVTLTLTGTPTTLVAEGSRAAVEVTGAEFATDADATIAALTAWAASTAYTLNQRRTNDGAAWLVTDPGTSAGSGGPLVADVDDDGLVADGGVIWRLLGTGTGAVDVAAESVASDAVVGVSGTITEIVTPVSGWNGVINVLDATLGSPVETDEAFRQRRDLELARPGDATINAIRADVLEVPGVLTCRVFHNPTDGVVDGMPPHSVEALVQGGDDQDIHDQLLASVAAGIQMTGTETGAALDSSGISQPTAFSRPDEVEIWVVATVSKDPGVYPLGGDDEVAAAIVAYGDAQQTGRDAVASAIVAAIFNVPGVLDASVLIGTAPGPVTSTPINITQRQLAVMDTSRISVTSTDGTP